MVVRLFTGHEKEKKNSKTRLDILQGWSLKNCGADREFH